MLYALVLAATLSNSPYLAAHANDAVRWQPWNEAVIARARREQKPIFLSIGYASCHWCHVMQRESFADPAVGRILNERYVPVLVDREEQPDVDAAFMTYVQLMNDGAGGWPANVILSPDLEPLTGTTYMPRDALLQVLQVVSESWSSDRPRLLAEVADLIAGARELSRVIPAARAAEPALRALVDQARRANDAEHGGFGTAPKFPQPLLVDFLLRESVRTGDALPRKLAVDALHAMADGALFDQIGGGFHRYTTDAAWRHPHFEKMLYDQALLSIDFVEAYQMTREPRFADVARRTLDFSLRELRDEGGAFISSLDSDTAAGEGTFYEWTPEELAHVLGADRVALVAARYGITGDDHLPYAATRDDDPAVRAQLLAARSQRTAPRRDDKVLAGWNGLMIAALARAGAALDEPRYLAAATEAARFVQSKLWNAKSKTLRRRWRGAEAGVEALTEDYAMLVGGVVDLYESSGDPQWLRFAMELQKRQDALFWRPEVGRYATGTRLPEHLAAAIDEGDGATPSANSLSAMNLLRLGELTDDDGWRARSDAIVATFSSRLAGGGMAAMASVLSRSLAPAKQIVIAGDRRDAATRALLRVVADRFLPNRTLLFADRRLPVRTVKPPPRPRAAAYLCEHYICKLPIDDPVALASALDNP